jgi:hypothetical protein
MKEEYFLDLLKKYNQIHILKHYYSLNLPEEERKATVGIEITSP